MPSKIDHPGTNPVCSSEMSLGSRGFNRLVNTLEKILYMVLHKAIGLKSPGFSGFSFLGIKAKKVEFISDKIEPPFLEASIAFHKSIPIMS
jgi:hypothetical protein